MQTNRKNQPLKHAESGTDNRLIPPVLARFTTAIFKSQPSIECGNLAGSSHVHFYMKLCGSISICSLYFDGSFNRCRQLCMYLDRLTVASACTSNRRR